MSLFTVLKNCGLVFGLMVVTASSLFADAKFDELIAAGKYSDAIAYADKNIPANTRNGGIWDDLGTAYRKTNAREKAIVCFKEAQTANPSDPEAYLGFGQCYFEDDKIPLALDNFQKSFLLNRSAQAAEGIALCAAKLSQWDKARDAAESAVSIDANVFDSRVILAQIYLKQEDYKGASAQLEVIVSKKAAIEQYKQLALCYEKLGQKDKLALIDPKIVDLDKKDVSSRRRLIEYALAKGDTAAAFVTLKELALLTPTDPKVFKSLYLLSVAKANKRDAVLYLKNYLVLDSSTAVPYKALGDLLYEQKDAEGALDAYRHALRLDPQIKGFYKKYEDMCTARGLEAEAVKVIRGGIAAGEADAASYRSLGDIYKKQKDWANAIKMYQDALKSDNSNVLVLTSLAESQALANDANAAIITYEQVVLMNPKAIKEYKALGDLSQKIGKEDNAISAYEKYLAKAPGDNAVAKTIGLYRFEKKQYPMAIQYLENVKDTTLQDVGYLLALGESGFNTQDFQKAAKVLAKAKARNLSAIPLKRVLKMLAESYEKIGDDAKAAEAYDAYTAFPDIRDADATYKKAFLREKTNKPLAMKLYQANAVAFPKDYRNLLRGGLLLAEDPTQTAAAATMLKNATLIVDTVLVVWQKLGDLYGKLKDEEKELAAYKRVIALDPQNQPANRRAGIILMNRKQTTAAIANLELSLTMVPKDLEVIKLLAAGYLETKRPEQAVGLLIKAKTLEPNNIDLRVQIYELAKQTGKAKEAETEIKELIDLKKDNKYRVLYAKDLVDQKRYNDFYAVNKDVMVADFMNIEGLMLKAKVQRIESKFAEANETYKSILFINENYAPALVERGFLFLEQSNATTAEGYFAKALKSDPKNALAELGLAKAAKMNKNMGAYADHVARAKLLDPKNKLIADEAMAAPAK